MKTPTAIDWKLTNPQYAFFTNPAKYRAFISGIGAGKTAIGIMAALNESIEQPGSVGIIVAPTYPLIRDVLYPELDKWLPRELVKEFSKHEHLLRLENGSVIRFRSAENDRQIERLRGTSIAFFWLDEASLMSRSVWDIMIGRLRQSGYNCKAWVTGTPKGFNWLYELFSASPLADSFVLTGVPTQSNVYLPDTYFNSLELQYSGAFKRQELFGEFVRFEGLVYDYSPSLITKEQAPKHPDMVAYGVDWGYKNPSCILGIAVKDGIYHVVEEFYKTKVVDYELTAEAKDMQDRHGVGVFYCDPSSPQSIEIFKREGINAVRAINDVNVGVRTVASLIAADKLVIHERCHNLINELQTYSYADGDRDMPIKLNDHACDALRYCIVGLGSVVEAREVQQVPSYFIPNMSRFASSRF